MPTFTYKNHHYTPLVETNTQTVADGIDCPSVATCLTYLTDGSIREHLSLQQQRDRDGLDMTFAISNTDDRVVGFFGVMAYRDGVEGITYLHETIHGSGLNADCAHIQWALADIADVPLYAGVKPHNKRSIRAVNKLWPHLMPKIVHHQSPNGNPYTALTWHLVDPPLGVGLNYEQREALRAVVIDAGWRRNS